MGSGSRSHAQAQADQLQPQLNAASDGAFDNVTQMVRLGLQRFQAGDAEGAARIFRTLVGASPDQPLAWNHLALALTSLGRHEEAAAALMRSLDLAPGQATTWSGLSSSFLQLGRLDDAERASDAALALDADQGAAWQVRALALTARNEFPGASEAFARAIALDGESAALCANLGATLLKCGRFAEAVTTLARAAALDATAEGIDDARRLAELALAAMSGEPLKLPLEDAQVDLMAKTALLLLDAAGERDGAIRLAEAWAARRPENPEARHLRDAALARPVERQPPELVAQRFDEMAEAFDQTLVERLGYDGPGQLGALLARLPWRETGRDILDLGCGTGLCAPVLKPLARRLAGVDLSAGMLGKACARGLYDSLERADLLDALGAGEAQWDLVVAMDALPYLGELTGVFTGVAAALRPHGWFAFSTERSEGDGFALQGNGRYAHGEGYILGLAAARFEVVATVETVLRREGGRDVPGGYYLLRRKS